ncbi:hypothetical protein Ahy_A09g041931 [Arachis hypogaea]|uniref:RNase H type-1 domain-containing protein n=1 Tax=Arachis hypogaea TaxID=3818 RepID=A0A445BEC3_ARAHY|nr:hypothetical protein Ahy_A09g041931 [Arachis hypogaea]
MWSTRTGFDKETTVDSLINQEDRTWNQEIINNTFLPFEAEQILELPLDIHAKEDSYYWKYNKKGDYEGWALPLLSSRNLAHRNKLIFNQEHSRPEALLEKAHQAYTEATKADLHVPLLQRTHPESQSANNWRTPEQGRYKVNVDAAIINDRRGGVGVVIKN